MISNDIAHLSIVFPGIQQKWLYQIARNYKDNRVERITEKIVQEFNGYYPKELSHNQILDELIQRFPDVDLEHCRNLILRYPANQVEQITTELLESNYPKRRISKLTKKDYFRSPRYIQSCKERLLNEFPFHWKNTILAIMAESNNDYEQCIKMLHDIPYNQIWTLIPFGKRQATTSITFDEELEQEIQLLQYPQNHKDDPLIAQELNRIEYESSGQLITCQCCYEDCCFEDLVSCNVGHLFCKKCIQRTLEEGMYGLGNLRAKEFLCLTSMEECKQEIPDASIKNSVDEDLYLNYQVSFCRKVLQNAGIEVAECPFCNYIEESAASLSRNFSETVKGFLYHYWRQYFIAALFTTLALVPGAFYTLYYTFFGIMIGKNLLNFPIGNFYRLVRERIRRFFTQNKKRFPILNCKNPKCLKASCISCKKEWKPLHECHMEEKDSLRLYMEQAMSQALIRICPDCQIRFSKLDGCNKMTCPNCGYTMCYVCRMDIRVQKYSHFCQHFRLVPGSCSECNKCDLYQREQDDEVVVKAANEAKREWARLHPEKYHLAKKVKVGHL